MSVEAAIKSITFSDGTVVPLPTTGVTVLVGPNNAGKSQALRDIDTFCGASGSHRGPCVLSVEIHKSGTAEEVSAWVVANAPQKNEEGTIKYVIEGWGTAPLDLIVRVWDGPTFGRIRSLFVFHANALNRLTGADAPQNANYAIDPPTHPIQKAYQSSVLEGQFDEISRRAFGLRTVVDRYGGSLVPLRVGKNKPQFTHDEGVPRQDYLDRLRAMPLLQDQGDGVKSFMGLLVHVHAGNHAITLVDEPEAFLHPPQSRLLGNMLAQRSAENGQQVVIATHSVDIIQGILTADTTGTTIIRLTREGDINRAAVLHNDDLTELWNDPLLKHSNVLDGLFHDAVVLCEGDSDCRLYSAVLESVQKEDASRAADEQSATANSRQEPDGSEELVTTAPVAARDPQILFTHCGGKARMPVVVSALRAVSVPTLVVADFDLLRDKNDVERSVKALGKDFAPLEADYRRFDAAVRNDEKPLGRVALKDALITALDEGPPLLDRRAIDALKGILRLDSGWEKVKRSGLAAVPQGDPYKACQNLLGNLRDYNIFVVPVGYLERFIPQIGGHGPGWVADVLAQRLHDDVSLSELRNFVRRLRDRARDLS